MTPQPQDERHMRQALRLAARARGRTSPNPMVGAVLVRGDEVLGQGYHRRAGGAHAEVEALAQAGAASRGADLYVNLEPCNHVGRTGPCARAIIDAGVGRVVLGLRDPNPLVNGKGIRALRRAGVKVTTGVLQQECQQLNEAFVCYIARQRPLVTFKTAVTLDGKVATSSGHSRWVSGAASRRASHRMRDTLDAICVGVGTVLADDPQLTCRQRRGGRDPVRVVVDSRLRTPPTARIVAAAARSPAPTLIVTTEGAAARRQRALERAGAQVLRVPADGGRHVDLPALLTALAQREVTSLLLEGGPRLAGAFFAAQAVDRVVAYVAPKLLGDPRGMSAVAGAPVASMDQATQLADVTVRRVGRDVMISGRVDYLAAERG